MELLRNYIGGKFLPPKSEEYIENYNPATGKVYSLIPDSDADDVHIAVEEALSAWKRWSITPAKDRSRILLRIADLIEESLEELALAESIDNGKPVSLTREVDIPRAAANFRFFATAILHESTETFVNENTSLNYTIRQPLGVVGCISPWNLPLYLFSWKIAPALAAGNCVVGKPSEVTPMTAYLLSKICIEAGLPPGVLNIVHGYGAKVGSAITSHPDIKAISFTGSTRTGKEIARVAAPMFKKLSLEMGGKNPFIVFADADYDRALIMAVKAAFSNQGQICLCGSRMYIEEKLYPIFVNDFVKEVRKLKVGDPLDESTNIGAVVSREHKEKVMSYIRLAEEEGGEILTGGQAASLSGRLENGYFIEPTVIVGLDNSCRTNQEEIFGPVVTLQPFRSCDDIITMANESKYGLAASVWTENLTIAHQIANQLETGIVWINTWMLRDLRTYFGGVKHSGVGREGGFEALKFFTEPKNICINIDKCPVEKL